MKNTSLVKDYLIRANDRLDTLDLLFNKKSWANVVLEAQEIVELSLKAYLRHINIEVPRAHDVSATLIEHKSFLTGSMATEINKVVRISKSLRRDREIAFYGTEDLTPSDFYSEEDAQLAREGARFVYSTVEGSLL